ncbi:MAG: amidohydrolase [Planctomyces sp.]|nr:amidohydrolase [Planctomyces sp.]
MLRCLVAVTACVILAASGARAADVHAWADAEVERLIPLYEHLHQNPELSFEERETARRIADELQAAGCEVTTGVGGHGVVGLLKNGNGPTVMFRCDLDALPVAEETGLPFASTKTAVAAGGAESGLMHACGHDLHMTNFIGVARFLAAHRHDWTGTAMLVAQPAEERGNGAQRMIEDGLFTRLPKPQFALALHCDSSMATGRVGWRAGYVCANTDSCDIVVRGRGGHGSRPEGCIDPIVQAAQLVLDLQTIVSREISPFEPAVITVGSIHGGSKHNIISDECRLQLTIRSYDPAVRDRLHESIRRKAFAVAESFGAPEPTVTFDEGTPAVFNDEGLVMRVVPSFEAVLGEENVLPVEPVMGGEDFSFYSLAGVPVFMFRLGTVNPDEIEAARREGRPLPTLHSAKYAPDVRPALRTGLVASTQALLSLMPPRVE